MNDSFQTIIEFDYHGINFELSVDGWHKLSAMAIKDDMQRAMYSLGVIYKTGDQSAYNRAVNDIAHQISNLLLTKPEVFNDMLVKKIHHNSSVVDIQASLGYVKRTRSIPYIDIEFPDKNIITINYYEPKTCLVLFKKRGPLKTTISFNRNDVIGYIIGNANSFYILTIHNAILVLKGHLFTNNIPG